MPLASISSALRPRHNQARHLQRVIHGARHHDVLDELHAGALDEADGLSLEDELTEVDGGAVLHERLDDAHAGQRAPLEGLRDVDHAAGFEQRGHSTQRLARVRQEREGAREVGAVKIRADHLGQRWIVDGGAVHFERLGQAGAGAGGSGLGDVALLVVDADDLQPFGGHQRRVRRRAQRSASADADVQHTLPCLQPPEHLRVPALSHVDDNDVVNLRGLPSREQDEEDEDGRDLEEHFRRAQHLAADREPP
mmetsp:Transcript_75231/g.181822  ORF Transcript_75231/g.181822 Transcript_75231/m.181822 type:complete len:252 (-) Transcript_75231:2-757(-)